MRKYQRGFTVVEGMLLVVLAGIIGGTGWYVYTSQKKTTQPLDNANKTPTVINTKTEIKSSPVADETANWKIFTSTLEKVSFNYPGTWKIIDQKIEKDTEVFKLKSPNNYILLFTTSPPIPRGAEATPILHLTKIDVPNFGSLYSAVAEFESKISTSIRLIDYSPDLHDGEKSSTFGIYTSKRQGKFEGVNPELTHYWVLMYGYFVDTSHQGDEFPKDMITKDFMTQPDVITTQKIFQTLRY